MNKEYTFFVQGMHCNACVLLTESEIGEMSHIHSVKADLKKNTLKVSGEFGERTKEQIAEELTVPLKSHGYTVLVEKQDEKKEWSDFVIAIPVALGILLLFVLLQKLNIVNWVTAGNVTHGTAFVIGVVASLSSCMAVVGGLVLSMAATSAKRGNGKMSQMLFHGGRLIGFFVFGGVIGMVGTAFTLNPLAIFVLSLIVGIVMIILGLNLLDVFPWAKKLQMAMPRSITSRAHGISKREFAFAPFLIGAATFFLPCGFTQSMQVYTLTTGSFLTGGLTMFSFALGTFPVLVLVSFGSLSIKGDARLRIFFKVAGLVVIAFALFNIINSLVAIGIVSPVFNF